MNNKLSFWFKHINFLAFITIVSVFFVLKKEASPFNQVISGDGLGYYAYLPALLINDDAALNFKEVDTVLTKYYAQNAFEKPSDNFLVTKNDRKINKYYPGLALIWTPFFYGAHVIAHTFNYPTDGYSAPYQHAITLAGLAFLFLGLYYLKQLLYEMFRTYFSANFVPLALFFGTYLFNYSNFFGAHSHVYSFAMLTMFVYFVHSFFTKEATASKHFFIALFLFVLLVCIRPLNGIIVFAIPAFAGNFTLSKILKLIRFKRASMLWIGLTLLVLGFTLTIFYIQTKSILPYAYPGEVFHFAHPRLMDALFSYRSGWLLYAPIIVLSFFGSFYLGKNKRLVLLVAILLCVIYLYSAWWYWIIIARTMIDFTVLFAILLAALLKYFETKVRVFKGFVALVVLTVGYHQLKCYQFRNGILVEHYSTKTMFWQNFGALNPTQLYVVQEKTLLQSQKLVRDFEQETLGANRVSSVVHTGKFSEEINASHPYSSDFGAKYPSFFSKKGVKQFRLASWLYCSNELEEAQVYVKFLNHSDSILFTQAFYINDTKENANHWIYKEFGCQLSAEQLRFTKAIKRIQVFYWNNKGKGSLYLDDVKFEFFLNKKEVDAFL